MSEYKTEKQKMLEGSLYLASDPELVESRLRARKFIRKYNKTKENETNTRHQILEMLFGEIGNKIEIEPPFFCDYGNNIIAGENLYMNFDCVLLDCCQITFGKNVMLGPKVQIYTAYHPIDPTLRESGKELAAPITIGDNVWIGGGSIICPKVNIGNNTTIGAGSVVTRNIPANVFAAGNPCKVIRQL